MSKLNLRRRWQRVRTVPGLGKDTAIAAGMVVLAAVALVWIQSNLSTGWPWAEHQVVRAEFAQVPGINPAATSPVTMAGVEVGHITAADPTDHDTAVLTLELTHPEPVYANARAVLRPKNPLNEMSVEINPGSPPAPVLGAEGIIPVSQTARPVQADEVFHHLDDRAQRALTDLLAESDVALARAHTELPDAISATTDAAVTLRPVMEALQTRKEKISQLVSALSQIVGAVGDNTDRTARLADSTQRTLGALASNDAALRASLAQLPGLSSELRAAMGGAHRLAGELNPTLDNLQRASEDLPPALDRLESTTGKLGDTVDAAAPVLDRAKAVVADLRPLAADLNSALDDVLPVTAELDRDTGIMLPYLDDVSGFVYNSSSMFAAGDAQGGIIRAHVAAAPGGGVIPEHKGYSPGPENGLDPAKKRGGIGPLGGN